MPPVVTALYGALNAFFNLVLAFRITVLRKKYAVSLGTGDVDHLTVAVRQHANNAEYLPLGILMLLLAELLGGDKVWLHVLGGTLLFARLSHAVGLPIKGRNPWRWLGTALTFTVIAVSGGYALYLRFKI